jgi:DNA-binding SARP family transcriptional activator
MDFRILGPLEAFTNGQPLALGGSKQRAVLALLLLHANETVSVDRLIEALWGERAPAGAVQSVRVHISRLRKVLNGGGGEGNGPSRLVTRSGGYQLNVEDDALDLARFGWPRSKTGWRPTWSLAVTRQWHPRSSR